MLDFFTRGVIKLFVLFRNRYVYSIIYRMSVSTQTFIVYLCMLSEWWLSMWGQTTKSVYTLCRERHVWTNSRVIPTTEVHL